MAAKKRKLEDIIAKLPSQEELGARLQPLFPSSQPLRLHSYLVE
jgi:hypothetical protein